MKNREIPEAEVFNFTEFKMNKLILTAKRNPKVPQAQICTLEAVLELYMTGCIEINWEAGEPYMSLSPDADLDEDELKERFSEIINGG
jgi:hypothetical protein